MKRSDEINYPYISAFLSFNNRQAKKINEGRLRTHIRAKIVLV